MKFDPKLSWHSPNLPGRVVQVTTFTLAVALACLNLVSPRDCAAQDADATIQQPDLEVEVPIWVEELDAGDARTRRQAERNLIDAGPAANEFMPAITDHLSIDAKERLARVQASWQKNKTKEEVKTSPIRLQDAKTLGEALEAISLGSGVEFDLEGGGPAIDKSKLIKPPTSPMEFWHALDIVLDQADLDINFYGGDRNRLMLIPRAESRPSRVDSAAYAGIYRLEPTIVTARRVLAAPEQSGLNLSMSISWQPNRTPIGLTLPISELTGILDDQSILLPQASGDSIDVSTSSELAQTEFFLPMELPKRDRDTSGSPQEIKRLTGLITALIPGDRHSFELKLQEVAANEKYDAMTVKIESVRKTGPLHEVRVGVELDAAGRALESHRQWIFENEAFVQLADGGRNDHLGYEVYRRTDNGVGIGYLFDLGGGEMIPPDAKLIYESPTSVIRSEVPFILNAIPLP